MRKRERERIKKVFETKSKTQKSSPYLITFLYITFIFFRNFSFPINFFEIICYYSWGQYQPNRIYQFFSFRKKRLSKIVIFTWELNCFLSHIQKYKIIVSLLVKVYTTTNRSWRKYK